MHAPARGGLTLCRPTAGGIFALLAVALLGASAGYLLDPAPADAHANHLVVLGFSGNDALYNYDFHSTSATASNVDLPATILFRNNAEVDKVKNILRPEYENTGDVKYARLKDGSSYVWDSDRGMKNPKTSCPDHDHMRLYADGDDRMYNTFDGYYVFAAAHYHYNENCSGASVGYTEYAEGHFATEFRQRGYSVSEDCACWWYNVENHWHGTTVFYNSNGYATRVQIP